MLLVILLTIFPSQTKNIMVSSYARTKEASQAKYISILNIIQGEVDPTQVFLTYYFCGCHLLLYLKLYYLGTWVSKLSIITEVDGHRLLISFSLLSLEMF